MTDHHLMDNWKQTWPKQNAASYTLTQTKLNYMEASTSFIAIKRPAKANYPTQKTTIDATHNYRLPFTRKLPLGLEPKLCEPLHQHHSENNASWK